MNEILTWISQHALIAILTLAGLIVYIWLMCFKNTFKRKWYEIFFVTIFFMLVGVFNLKLLAVIEALGNLKTAANMRLLSLIHI